MISSIPDVTVSGTPERENRVPAAAKGTPAVPGMLKCVTSEIQKKA